MSTLRPYQHTLEQGVYKRWASGSRNVLGVLPTGGGKTVTFSKIVHDWPGTLAPWLRAAPGTAAVAHRRELVGQMSLALARYGVRHRVIGPDKLRRSCTAEHMSKVGRSYYDPGASCAVAGIDTLINMDPKDPFFGQVGLWVMDEAHHVLKANKWGKGCAMFPHAWGLGVTATPTRADGKGLGRHAHGLFDDMEIGPTMRELINDGYLTDYVVSCPESDIDLSKVHVGESGEYVQVELKAARRASHLTGDVVKSYLQFCPGALGVVFDVDVESASETAQAFRDAGVPAEVVHAGTPETLRGNILDRFKSGEIRVLVNVDLFGEGFDLPAIEVVIMARPTQSYSLYVQQFGRALRLMVDGYSPPQWDALGTVGRRMVIAQSRKPRARIIDHVGNIARHKLPDAWREWSLDARERGTRGPRSDAIPTWVCSVCACSWERTYKLCQNPGCPGVLAVSGRSAPEHVDGDMIELSAEAMASLRGEVAHVDSAFFPPKGLPEMAAAGALKRHRARQQAQTQLRHTIALWAGLWKAEGFDDSHSYRRFYHLFGLDVMTAQALGAPDAEKLQTRVADSLRRALQQKGIAV